MFAKKIKMTKNILLLCIALMGISAIAQNTYVPDDNFEQALIDLGYDSGALDDYIPTANINSITSLNLNRKGIKDLTGIKDFIALTFLNAAYNQLSSVDVSKNVALNTLVLSSNLLKTVDLSKNLALEKLYLDNNPIASVDFSNNPLLSDIRIERAKLTTMDVSKNTALKTLYVHTNLLTTIDLSKNVLLENFYGGDNKFTNIDLSKNTALKALDVGNNQLSAIDVSMLSNLEYLYVNNNKLKVLNVSKKEKLISLTISNNQINELDISSSTLLQSLSADKNELKSISFPEKSSLRYLLLQSNELTSLDLSKNTILVSVNLESNNLTSLNIKTGNIIKINPRNFNITKNPNLLCVEVDNPEWFTANFTNKDAITVYNEDCTTVEKKTYVPDDNFEQALIDLGYDSGALDDYVPTANINSLTNLTLRTKEIKNLTGIEAFKALEYIDVANNELTNLDVSQNLNLISITAYNNKITSIDVSKNLALINLHLAINQLTTIDITKNINIKTLFLFENKLTSLDVSKQLGLTQLSAYQNQLTAIDLTVNTALISVYLQSNKLVSLTIKNGNNTKIVKDKFHVNDNPELSCIQVDNAAWSKSNWTNKDGKAVFKEDCSLPIAQTYVPDDNFEQALIDLGYDSGVLDDYVPTENISVINALNVSDKGITDLTGIEDFAALIQLEVRNNNLKTVDISKNTTIKRVSFEGNKLTEVNFSTLTELQYVNLKKNELSTIDLSNNTKLQDVFVSNNPHLMSVNLKNGNNEEIAVFQSRNTPKLTCVQVSNVEWSTKVWVDKDEAITYSENCALSVNDLELNNEINLYPNPVINKMYITNLSVNAKSIHVYNLLGELVFKTSVNQGKNKVNLESLTSGIYLVKVGSYVKRIVKK
ncbi:exported hypothetical protein [Tenacibaculum sp. 190524A02b]